MLEKFNLINADNSDEDTNPMDGIANMVDAMLVLAVGIMLALIINWNVDIGTASKQQVQQNVNTDNALEFSNDELQQMSGENDIDGKQNLTQLGSVYYDKDTGTYYIVNKDQGE